MVWVRFAECFRAGLAYFLIKVVADKYVTLAWRPVSVRLQRRRWHRESDSYSIDIRPQTTPLTRFGQLNFE